MQVDEVKVALRARAAARDRRHRRDGSLGLPRHPRRQVRRLPRRRVAHHRWSSIPLVQPRWRSTMAPLSNSLAKARPPSAPLEG